MTREDETPTTPLVTPRTARRPSSASFRRLRPEDQAEMYSSEVSGERVRELAFDSELNLGATLAHEMRALIREWARADFAAGAERVADLETALAAQREINERQRAELAERVER